MSANERWELTMMQIDFLEDYSAMSKILRNYKILFGYTSGKQRSIKQVIFFKFWERKSNGWWVRICCPHPHLRHQTPAYTSFLTGKRIWAGLSFVIAYLLCIYDKISCKLPTMFLAVFNIFPLSDFIWFAISKHVWHENAYILLMSFSLSLIGFNSHLPFLLDLLNPTCDPFHLPFPIVLLYCLSFSASNFK